MEKLIKHLKPKSEFSRNILTLITGTTIGQVLPIAAAPILTRIFTPEDFGLFAFYFAIISILAVLATARYELAIILPKRPNDAYQILILSCVLSATVSFCTLLIIWLFEMQIIELIENPSIADFLYWIPISIFFMGLYQPLYYWFNREKGYKKMANSRIVQASSMVSSQVAFGLLTNLTALGLILGQLLGQFLATLYMSQKFIKDTRNIYKPKKLKQLALAKRYINFPKFLMVAHAMNASSRLLPNVLINIFFSATAAGLYLLIQRVIGAPLSIIGNAVGDVFRQQASKAYIERRECIVEYKKTFIKLIIISLLPFCVLFFIAPDLFSIVFGESWRKAGEYAQILMPMFFFQFVASPLSVLFIIAEKQKEDLSMQTVLLFGVVLSFFLTRDVKTLLVFISMTYSLIYIWVIYKTYKFSRGCD